MTMNLEIPDGLGDMLRDFTIEVLRDRPSNLYDFAAEYFVRMRETRKAKSVPMYIIVDSDDEAGEPDKEHFKPLDNGKSRYARRQSVSAERYDPEAEDDDDDRVVYPKTDEQRERLVEAIAGILLFRSLEPEQMQEVTDAMFERKVEPGEDVIKQGADGDNFYVIQDGRYNVFVSSPDKGVIKVHEFVNQGSFGELALMYNQPRSATITAKENGTLWAMDRNSFRRIILRSAFKKRKLYEDFLGTVDILQHLDAYERMNVADALVARNFPANACIIKEGDEADGMYFIESGNCRVTCMEQGKEIEITTMNKGKYFGERALLENIPRTASVYAISDVKAPFLERESFERLLGPCKQIMSRKQYAHD